MTTIEEIPSDEPIEMTELFHRAFNAAGCDPMCHCCEKMISVGKNFKLATIKKAQVWWGGDIELKLKERKGKEITEKDLWEAHNVTMRFDGYFRLSSNGRLINNNGAGVSYKEFISNTDQPWSREENGSVFMKHDLDNWEEIKNSFKDSSHEVMLCETCTPDEFARRETLRLKSKNKEFNKPKGGCFRVNGKIVH